MQYIMKTLTIFNYQPNKYNEKRTIFQKLFSEKFQKKKQLFSELDYSQQMGYELVRELVPSSSVAPFLV